MKKLFLLASAGLILASCADDLGYKSPESAIEGKALISATYATPDSPENGTRTEWTWGTNSQGKWAPSYKWSVGDAIGVFPVVTSGEGTSATTEIASDLNAFFRYTGTTPETTGNFTGDYGLTGTEYAVYAYYPYNPEKTVTPSSDDSDAYITLNINQTQNYNFTAVDQTSSNQDGSFSQEMAPAVAYGEYDEGLGQFQLSFAPVGSYIGIPVVGLTPAGQLIKTLTLTITNGTSTSLWGPVNAPLNETIGSDEYYESIEGLDTDKVSSGENTYITINCGVNGVNLDETNPTWFWFVVPAGININSTDGVVYNLYVNATAEELEDLSEVTPDMTSTKVVDTTTNPDAKATLTVANTYYSIYKEKVDGVNQPFKYSPKGTVVIENAYQFLEYAYLATVEQSEYESAWDEIYNTSDADNFLLPQALIGYEKSEGLSNSTITGLYPALITNNIIFTPDMLDNNNPYLQYGPYAEKVFTSYMNGEFPSIGGEYAFSLTGYGDDITIAGLTVYGDGMFASPKDGTEGNTVANLGFKEIVVTPEANDYDLYNFLGQIYFSTSDAYPTNTNTYEDLTFTDCSFGTIEDATSPKYALFGMSQGSDETVTDVTPWNGVKYANVLRAAGTFAEPYDLSETINDYNVISNSANPGIFEVSGQPQAEQFLTMINKPWWGAGWDGAQYSVVDGNNTSYWTGTSWQAVANQEQFYAENLAYVVEKHLTSQVTLTYDLNLMGLSWPVSRYINNAINLNGNSKTISDVLIDGTNVVGTNGYSSYYYSLLGRYATVKDLTISGMVVDNTTEGLDETQMKNAQIAAICSTPATGGVSNVTVNDFTVISTAGYKNVSGGLFNNITGTSQLSSVTGCTINALTDDSNYGDLAYGWFAGQMNLEATATATITGPVVQEGTSPEGENQFGEINITINPTNPDASITITIENFMDDITVDNFVAGTNCKTDYTFYLIQNNYQTTYKYNGTKFVSQGGIAVSPAE